MTGAAPIATAGKRLAVMLVRAGMREEAPALDAFVPAPDSVIAAMLEHARVTPAATRA